MTDFRTGAVALLLGLLSRSALAQVPSEANRPPPPAKLPAPTIAAVSSAFNVKLYGFVEADGIWDSTRSFNDLAGNAAVARPESLAARHGRLQTSIRNSRFGLRFAGPHSADVKVFTESLWADANVFWDIDGAMRVGAEYAYLRQLYADGESARNDRVQLSGFYLF